MRRVLAYTPAALWALVLVVHLAAFAKGGLFRVIAWLFLEQLVPLGSIPLLLVALGVAAFRRAVGPATGATIAVALLGALPGLVGFGLVPMAFPATIEGTTPHATVRLPMDAPMVVAWGGDTPATNYHVSDPGQRWAYDLLVEPAGHGSADLAAYGCYGQPVLAPAAGVVTHAEDGHPEQRPDQFAPNYEAPAGNFVSIRLETETHLVLAHLQPGSVAVAEGDTVVEGQVLGRCGNSGNTSEPHVHIHHQRQDPHDLGLLGEGLPLFFRDHDGPPMPKGGIAVEGESFRFTGDVVRHMGHTP
ncbi:MAG: M23 family metallopeptidase [Alphaproteobacteria bacterium]|nr:M23 family metallopeptidase [Alphaproteobacteria bacterium]